MDTATKARELIDFAESNGIYIHNRTDPFEWANTLEEHDWQCPCKHAPSCPCDDALVRIKGEEVQPENQMCGCVFFVSKAYLDHYGRKPWAAENSPTSKPTKPSLDNFTFKKTEEVDPELEQQALGKVETYLTSLEFIRDNDFNKLDNLLAKEEKNSQECDFCVADAEIIRANAQFVGKVCQHGDPACEEELGRLIARTEEVITENFMVAGYRKIPVNKKTAANPAPGKVKDTRQNSWIAFNSEVAKDPLLNGKNGKYKMKIAAGLYRGEYETVKEAMDNIPEHT
ncbi:MAG: hypothetical protein PHP89_05400 [Candidatus Omnitrophica bacterium]|nr:hypothetical protein [Candidatus Omnitrophota bacterium]